jgi:thymidylate synthase (FAD)
MASACIEINTTRDIGRQILRHRSFHFQEFSQRYASVTDPYSYRDARLQDSKNRQNSLVTTDENLLHWWDDIQTHIQDQCHQYYNEALEKGIAKEVARAILPEGMTPTRMYMAGTIRDWYHYCNLRTANGTQLEHQLIAKDCSNILHQHLPMMFKKYE